MVSRPTHHHHHHHHRRHVPPTRRIRPNDNNAPESEGGHPYNLEEDRSAGDATYDEQRDDILESTTLNGSHFRLMPIQSPTTLPAPTIRSRYSVAGVAAAAAAAVITPTSATVTTAITTTTTTTTTTASNEVDVATHLAQDALRMAIEARHAAERLRLFRSNLPAYRAAVLERATATATATATTASNTNIL
jgi:hypothetical protein